MIGSKEIGAAGVILLLSLILSCASGGPAGPGYSNYRDGMFQGYQLLTEGQYQPAIQEFLRANQGDPTKAWPMALGGQTSYQMGNYAQASQYLAQAAGLVKDDDYAYPVIKGYQCLSHSGPTNSRKGWRYWQNMCASIATALTRAITRPSVYMTQERSSCRHWKT